MTVVAEGRAIIPPSADGVQGTIRWAINASSGPLALLDPSKRQRNSLVRNALLTGGNAWRGAFLPRRFSDYVDRSPFPYPSHRLGFFVNKLRRMGILNGILQRVFHGWDPWSANKPPIALMEDWKRRHPGKYKRSITGQYSGLIADIRANAKRMVREIAEELWSDGKILPLVESGKLRETALAGARTTATATASRATIYIRVPFPGPRNPVVGRVIKTLPRWEVEFIARVVQRALARSLQRRLAVTGADQSRVVSVGGERPVAMARPRQVG